MSAKNFKITRADDCVWLDDLRVPRGKDVQIHMTAEQARRVGTALLHISKEKPPQAALFVT